MKITNENLMRLAGLSALLAGVCYVLVGFHPANVPASVTTTRWQAVHIIACAMSVFGVLGMAGLYAKQAVSDGLVGLLLPLLLSAWFVLIMGFSFVEAFVLPHVASAVPGFVQAWMGMFNGPSAPSTSEPADDLDPDVACLHPGRPDLRYRDVPRRNLPAMGGCAAGRLHRLSPGSCPAPQRISAEDCHPNGYRAGLARLLALVTAANRTGCAAARPRTRNDRMSITSTSFAALPTSGGATSRHDPALRIRHCLG